MGDSLFISDLHLSDDRPATTELFVRFARESAARASELYILGDLFEYWAGDDDSDSALAQVVIGELAALGRAGVALYFMHGNRDFLVGEAFAQRCGARILADPHRCDLHGVATLLMHGDLLCTDDARYQAFRAQVRQAQWQSAFLAKPLAERKRIIDDLRDMSEREKGAKSMDIMDVNADTVVQYVRQYKANRIIHGHTHRSAQHELHVDAVPRQRWVLADWYQRGGYLRVNDGGCALIRFDS